MSANDKQPGGSHYRAAYQHWDFIADTGLGYFEAQVTKYISRHRKKNGLLDVLKAEHFLEKMIELRMHPNEHFCAVRRSFPLYTLTRYLQAQEPPLEKTETEIVLIVSRWERAKHLQDALHLVRLLKAQYAAADEARRLVRLEERAALTVVFDEVTNFVNPAEPTRAYNAQSLDRPEPGREAS